MLHLIDCRHHNISITCKSSHHQDEGSPYANSILVDSVAVLKVFLRFCTDNITRMWWNDYGDNWWMIRCRITYECKCNQTIWKQWETNQSHRKISLLFHLLFTPNTYSNVLKKEWIVKKKPSRQNMWIPVFTSWVNGDSHIVVLSSVAIE